MKQLLIIRYVSVVIINVRDCEFFKKPEWILIYRKTHPTEKAIMYNVRDVSGSQVSILTSLPFVWNLKYRPSARRLADITPEENISSGFLPARSTIRAPTADITTCQK